VRGQRLDLFACPERFTPMTESGIPDILGL
jgi:hypothetical protein